MLNKLYGFYLCLVSYLGIVGGKSKEDTVDCVLSASVSDDLARHFNWNGLKRKRCFGKLELINLSHTMFIK